MDPADFKCPISQEVMTDPVLAADGHTYEREMIAEWLRIRRTSPLTNEQMPSTNLMPNITLKKVIEGWVALQQAPQGVPDTPRSESSPYLSEVEGDELEAVKHSVYSAYDSNDEVLLVRRVMRVRNESMKARYSR